MSHRSPVCPVRVCEKETLSRLPCVVMDAIAGFLAPPQPTPTAAIIKQVVSVQLGGNMDEDLWWRNFGYVIFPNRGFEKYLFNHFEASPGSVWTHRFTHRKLGHSLFFNFIVEDVWIYGGGVDGNGDSIKYQGLEKFLCN